MLHLTKATAGNGMITNNSFDGTTGRLLNICATTDSGSCDGNVANLTYAWDTVGNLTQRQDTIEGTTENFCYDVLNRLNQSAFGATCSSSFHKVLSYGASGTVTRKSDVCNTAGCMTYGASAGPHALTGITGTVNGIVNPTFTYDTDGNMTAGLGRTMTWTTFNSVATIAQGSTTLGYAYGPNHDRYKECLGGCTSPTTTTLYLNGPTSEEKVTTGSTVTWRDYIVADGSIVAERFNIMGVISTRYFVGDHLGSTAALTDETGAVAERDFYDSWGKQRTGSGGADTTCSLPPASQTTRGFTTQEHVDPVCLDNFNARMYDPQIGQFMSADSEIPDGMNGQSFDRYTYLTNNPLNATDPSGHGECFGCAVTKIYLDGNSSDASSTGDGGAIIPAVPDGCGGAPCTAGPANCFGCVSGGTLVAMGGGGFGANTSGGGGDGRSDKNDKKKNPKNCPAGPYRQLIIGGSGTIAVIAGLTISVNFGESFPTDSSAITTGTQFFATFSVAGHLGVGGFIGAGAQGGAGRTNGPLSTGISVSAPYDAEAEGGDGVAIGVSGQVDPNPNGGGSASVGLPIPKIGGGIGAYAGAGRAGTLTLATPPIGC